MRFPHPQPRAMPEPKPEHCSAFAATGPATADGKAIIGHITMFSLYPSLYYNVWLPMSYWTNRVGGWRDAYTYTATNIARVRSHIGIADAPVHTIGGIGDESTTDDIDRMFQAAVDQQAIGGSIYDYRTTGDDLWPHLQPLR